MDAKVHGALGLAPAMGLVRQEDVARCPFCFGGLRVRVQGFRVTGSDTGSGIAAYKTFSAYFLLTVTYLIFAIRLEGFKA